MVKSSVVLSHVAFVLPSVEKAAAVFVQRGFKAGSPEVFDGEGTKEIYIGDTDNQTALPLLMQPLQEGSYMKALQKRGPGLHHIAVDVESLEDYLSELKGSGWFLHINSLQSAKDFKTVYLARPGVPALIEVQEKSVFPDMQTMTTPVASAQIKKDSVVGDSISSNTVGNSALITELHLNLNDEHYKMIRALGLKQIYQSTTESLVLGDQSISFAELY